MLRASQGHTQASSSRPEPSTSRLPGRRLPPGFLCLCSPVSVSHPSARVLGWAHLGPGCSGVRFLSPELLRGPHSSPGAWVRVHNFPPELVRGPHFPPGAPCPGAHFSPGGARRRIPNQAPGEKCAPGGGSGDKMWAPNQAPGEECGPRSGRAAIKIDLFQGL
jgi:hypothetical protein